MNCRNCGAPMRLEEEKEYFRCDYCHAVHFPERNGDGVRALGEPAAESCPVCKVQLTHAAVEGHRLFYCERCRGLLVPMDRFVAMVQDLRSRHATRPAAPRSPKLADLRREIRCPRCRERMHTHPYAGPGNIVIDNCPRCRLNWLDHSELRRIAAAPDSSRDPEAWSAV